MLRSLLLALLVNNCLALDVNVKSRASGNFISSANLYKFENSVVFVKVKKRSYPKGVNRAGVSFTATGHGVIIRENGYILVNNSLLDEAVSALVVFPDDVMCEAKVIARDVKTDLAIIKISAKNLKPAAWAEGVVKGSELWVVSSPFNMRFSLLHSFVSHDSRPSKVLGNVKSCYGNVCELFESKLIQYETANSLSNGILFDSEGKLVGITTSLFANLGLVGMNFAVPCYVARKVANDLITYGKVQRSYAGIKMQPIDDKLFEANKMNKIPLHEFASTFGAIVVDIAKDSPAEKSNLRPQDILVTVDGQLVLSAEDARLKIVEHVATNPLVLEVWRRNVPFVKLKDSFKNEEKKDEKKIEDKANMPIKEASKVIVKEPDVIASHGEYQLLRIEFVPTLLEQKKPNIDVNCSKYVGLKLVKLSKEDAVSRARSGISDNVQNGLIVADIYDYAFALELMPGDIIIQIQHQAVSTLADFDKVIAKSLKNNEKYIILLVGRKNATFSCAIETANIRFENVE